MTDEHSSPIKTPKQLIIVVLVAFAVPIALAVLISQLVTSGPKGVHEDDSKVLARIQPVANVVLAEPSGPKGMLTGEQVYGQVCKTCHEAGIAGAPKFGDKAAWSARIAQGEATMEQHAIAGFQGKAGAMPAKGGNAGPDRQRSPPRRRVHGQPGRCDVEGACRADRGRRLVRAYRRAGRGRDLRQVPRDRRRRRAEDRRPRRVDQAREGWLRPRPAIGAEGTRGHARARGPGGTLRRRDQARDRLHAEVRKRYAGAG